MNYIDIHSVAWSRLQAQRERLPHALLLIGQRGLGKLALAQTFAKALLCEQPEKGGLPCEHCLACNWLGIDPARSARTMPPVRRSAPVHAVPETDPALSALRPGLEAPASRRFSGLRFDLRDRPSDGAAHHHPGA